MFAEMFFFSYPICPLILAETAIERGSSDPLTVRTTNDHAEGAIDSHTSDFVIPLVPLGKRCRHPMDGFVCLVGGDDASETDAGHADQGMAAHAPRLQQQP
jgi:hypothetical protein